MGDSSDDLEGVYFATILKLLLILDFIVLQDVFCLVECFVVLSVVVGVTIINFEFLIFLQKLAELPLLLEDEVAE